MLRQVKVTLSMLKVDQALGLLFVTTTLEVLTKKQHFIKELMLSSGSRLRELKWPTLLSTTRP